MLTKLALKNEVDDLVDRFRAYHKRQGTTTLAELRRNYDMLLLKVLSLLQDSDPPLARDIVKSRAAIWSVLEDPGEIHRVQSDGRSNTVSIRTGALALVGVGMTVFVGPLVAVEATRGDVAVTKDLTAVIALQGLPCGNVVSATQQGQDDYVASCENGKRYRVFVGADGRVTVEKID